MVYFPTFSIKNQPNVGKYTSPMDGMGNEGRFFRQFSPETLTVFSVYDVVVAGSLGVVMEG